MPSGRSSFRIVTEIDGGRRQGAPVRRLAEFGHEQRHNRDRRQSGIDRLPQVSSKSLEILMNSRLTEAWPRARQGSALERNRRSILKTPTPPLQRRPRSLRQ